jgi:hypothetical protein
MNKCFQVSANTTEVEMVKVRERDGCDDRRTRVCVSCLSSFYIAVGNRKSKVNIKHFQVGHERNPLDQSIWMEVRGWVDHVKMECEEAHSG